MFIYIQQNVNKRTPYILQIKKYFILFLSYSITSLHFFTADYRGAASFKLTTEEDALVPNYDIQCLSWRKTEKQKLGQYNDAILNMPTCPCAARMLFFDRQFNRAVLNGPVFTVSLVPGREYYPFGKVTIPNFSTLN